MGENVGQINLGLDISQKSFNQQLSGISKGAEKSASSAFSGLGKKIGFALGTAAIIGFTKSCLELGSNLSEVQNVVDTTFTTMSDSVNNFAKNAMEQFGLSETVAKKYVGVLGTMSKSMGFNESQAYDMATAVTGLAGDVASFYNLSSDEAYTKLKSIWTGETESLKDLGVILTQTNLDQYALNNGFGRTTAKMTEQEKVMLRYQYTLSALGAAQGDFTRTSDSWANQTRVLSLRFDSLKATLGQGFINLFTPIIRLINNLMASLGGLAQKFVAFTELITGKSASDTAASAIGSVVSEMADSTDTLSDATSNLGSTAADAAKEASIGLAGFDKLNNVSDDSSSGSSGGGGSSSGLGSSTGLLNDVASATDECANKVNSSISKITDKIKELSDLFKEGFKTGLGDIDFSQISDNVGSIKDSIVGIFTDSEVVSAGNTWLSSVATSMGKVTGSFASIGVTIASLISGSISTYFDQNSDFIKGKLVSLFDITARGAEIYSNLMVALASIFTVFSGEDAQQIGADFIAIFANSDLSIRELIAQLGVDVVDCIATPIIDNQDKIKTALEGALGIISTIVGTVKDFVGSCFESIKTSYDTHVGPAFDKISSGMTTISGAFLDAWNKYIGPTIQAIADRFSEFVTSSLSPLVSNFTDKIGKIIDTVATLYEECLAPFIAWVVENLAPVFSAALIVISDAFLSAWESINTILGYLLDAFGGLLDFIKGSFTGDWKLAMTGLKTVATSIFNAINAAITSPIKLAKKTLSTLLENIKDKFDSVFGGIKDSVSKIMTNMATAIKTPINSILGAVEFMANGVIRGINKAINAMNNLSFDVPDWVPIVGGKSLGFTIPTLAEISIPKLAAGGYVEANTPQLAMIGDNRHQGEVVAPEDKLQELLNKAVSSSGASNLQILEIMALLRDIKNLLAAIQDKNLIAYITSSELFKSMQKEAKEYTAKTRKPAFS